MDDLIGLKQAAEQLGVSKDTLWRAIRRQELEAERNHGPSGTQYWLSWQKVEEWWEYRRSGKRNEEEAPQASETIVGRVVMEFPWQAPQASEEACEVLEAPAVEVLSALAVPEAVAVVPAEVHLQALRLVERAQLQVEAMRYELHSTRKVLSEQAESLAEKETRARQAELLREENQRNQALWEVEKSQLVIELAHHRDRVNWLEKRVPGWVRGLFGAK